MTPCKARAVQTPAKLCGVHATLFRSLLPPGSVVALPLPIHCSQCCRDNSALSWQDVLPDNRQLLQLTQFDTSLFWRPLDPNRLARSCSHLQQLSLCCCTDIPELTTLLQLTALSSVWLFEVIDSRPVASVAQLRAAGP